MRRTSLHNVKFNRTDFTADILFNELFKCLSYAREILVTEIIHNSRLIFLALKLYALGNCDDNGFVLCHLISYVLEELFGGKVIFRESVEKDLNKRDVEGAVPYNLHKNEFTLTA